MFSSVSVVVQPQLAAQPSLLTLLQQDGGENRRVKVRKLIGRDKDILTGKAKVYMNKTKKGILSLHLSIRQVFRALGRMIA